MERRRLGSSGPELSVVGFGAWEASPAWGSDLDEGRVIEAIAAGAASGINWVDTAEAYGPHTSEEIVGRAIAGTDMLVATKVAPRPAGSGFHPDEIRKACDGSLSRLGRDVIDLYQLHWPDPDVRVEDTWEAMAALRSEGLVRAIGVSNFDQAMIERCERVAHVDSLQPHLSMLHRSNLDLVAWCGDRGIGVVAYGPLAYGLLTGAITEETRFAAGDWRSGERGLGLYERFFSPENRKRHLLTVDSLRPVAASAGTTLAGLAIAWVLHQKGVTAAIAGSRDPEHTRANAEASSVALTGAHFDELGAILGV